LGCVIAGSVLKLVLCYLSRLQKAFTRKGHGACKMPIYTFQSAILSVICYRALKHNRHNPIQALWPCLRGGQMAVIGITHLLSHLVNFHPLIIPSFGHFEHTQWISLLSFKTSLLISPSHPFSKQRISVVVNV
jgi:hypothetical protein